MKITVKTNFITLAVIQNKQLVTKVTSILKQIRKIIGLKEKNYK